jgi:hypothetical protein
MNALWPWIAIGIVAMAGAIIWFRNRTRGTASSDSGGDFSYSSGPSDSGGWFSSFFGASDNGTSDGGSSDGGGGGDSGGGSD